MTRPNCSVRSSTRLQRTTGRRCLRSPKTSVRRTTGPCPARSRAGTKTPLAHLGSRIQRTARTHGRCTFVKSDATASSFGVTRCHRPSAAWYWRTRRRGSCWRSRRAGRADLGEVPVLECQEADSGHARCPRWELVYGGRDRSYEAVARSSSGSVWLVGEQFVPYLGGRGEYWSSGSGDERRSKKPCTSGLRSLFMRYYWSGDALRPQCRSARSVDPWVERGSRTLTNRLLKPEKQDVVDLFFTHGRAGRLRRER